MQALLRLLVAIALATLAALIPGARVKATTQAGAAKSKISWKKVVIDRAFRSEGVCVADFNKDGKADIFVGDVWYEAPDWKVHEVRPHKKYDGAAGYSDAFACFTGDFNGDGYPDAIVIPFPGAPCYWYENPGSKGGQWTAHLLTSSACNETPIYIDLFGTGKKVLVMGWQPPGKDNQGQMCYFTPGKDPTQPWQKLPISEPSQKGKEIPGTQRFSHGLGHGDVNGDGRIDIIIPGGWWEQPAKVDGTTPWKFHAADLNPACADMFTYDIDGDGKADIISSSAHDYGLWWHQQKEGTNGPSFIRREFFQPPPVLTKLPKDHGLKPEELALLQAVNKARNSLGKASWKISPSLNDVARAALAGTKPPAAFHGSIKVLKTGDKFSPDAVVKNVLQFDLNTNRDVRSPALEIGVAYAPAENNGYGCAIVLADSGAFSLPAQTHALHCVDINGDGLRDLVTGRRYWAHGPRGDAAPNDPAYLYWFEAKRDSKGFTTFIPHEIDDDSGIGTQFAVEDVNSDGLLDIIVSNKKGVFLFLQIREAAKE